MVCVRCTELLALASEELEPDDVANIGWLVCGLAELVQDVRHELGGIEIVRPRGKPHAENSDSITAEPSPQSCQPDS
ncbi:hypothetical protein MTYM_02300 [Methylococcales bacterium]|nr:hypothetical protein MTYM_02300 [Methylococcales bacterium]